MEPARGPITFILRLSPDASGSLRGVVQRVLTRQTSRFEGDERLVEILREVVCQEGQIAAEEGREPGRAGAEPRPAEEQL
jgi:hypothetical protein